MSVYVVFRRGLDERTVDVSGIEAPDRTAHAKNVLMALMADEHGPVDGWSIAGIVDQPEAKAIEHATKKTAKETR